MFRTSLYVTTTRFQLVARRPAQGCAWRGSASTGMGAIHKMAPVGVCGALLHTGPCWMCGWLREAEKNSPSESYFLLFLLEYAWGDTYRRSLCSKNLKNQARERVRARFFYFFFRVDGSEQCGAQNSVHCRVAWTVTDCGCRRQAKPSLGFCFLHRKEFNT